MDVRTLRTWADEGCPTDNELEAAWWIAARWRAQAERARGQFGESTAELRRRKLAAEAELTEERLAILRGAHVPLDQVDEAISNIARVVENRLRGLPSTMARRLNGKSIGEAATLLKRATGDVLRELSSVEVHRELGEAAAEETLPPAADAQD